MTNNQTNLCVRIDKDVKADFDKLCNELGLTLTTAITAFIKRSIREQRIPFEIGIPDDKQTKK